MAPHNTMLQPGQSLTLVAALGRNREIGLAGGMPWHLPRDLQHFKSVTMGHAILMGRRTWQSLPKALPGRLNIVVTRQQGFVADAAEVAHSLEQACRIAADQGADNELMVIGGAQLYSACLPHASCLQLTMIDVASEADTWFPDWQPDNWRELNREQHAADKNNPHAVTFVTLQRKLSAPD